jgi:GTPase
VSIVGRRASQLPGTTDAEVDASLDELERCSTPPAPRSSTGSCSAATRPTRHLHRRGKVAELRELVAAAGADAVVFDDDLAPAQQRTLEETIRRRCSTAPS